MIPPTTYPPIDWFRLSAARQFYESQGFRYVEVPWLVDSSAVDVTLPPDRKRFDTWAGTLVGSGEQSFIAIRDRLRPGDKLQTITPCFRDEHETDGLHFNWFMKLELIHVLPVVADTEVRRHAATALSKTAVTYFRDAAWTVGVGVDRVARVPTTAGWDVQVGGVEVGSYGSGLYQDQHDPSLFVWAYGTGLAEPRLSQALARIKDTE